MTIQELMARGGQVIRWRLMRVSPVLCLKLQQVRDSQGTVYLWTPGSVVQGPLTINGLPFMVDEHIPDGAAALVGAAFDREGNEAEVWALWRPEVIPRPAGQG